MLSWGGSMSGLGVPQFSKRKLIYGVGVNDCPTTTKANDNRVYNALIKYGVEPYD